MGKKETITIPKKTLASIAQVIGIAIVLIARNKAPEVLLFFIGVGCGIFIGKTVWEMKKNPKKRMS